MVASCSAVKVSSAQTAQGVNRISVPSKWGCTCKSIRGDHSERIKTRIKHHLRLSLSDTLVSRDRQWSQSFRCPFLFLNQHNLWEYLLVLSSLWKGGSLVCSVINLVCVLLPLSSKWVMRGIPCSLGQLKLHSARNVRSDPPFKHLLSLSACTLARSLLLQSQPSLAQLFN